MIRKLFLLSFLFCGLLSYAEKAIPYLSSPVIDDVGILSSSEKESLADYIRTQKALLQMQVWVTSLEGESIEGLSIRAAKQWALGTEKRDNGILFLIAPAERRMRIEVGRGLEGDIPDILTGRILDLMVRPSFRQGQYAMGIRQALEELVVLASGGPQAEKAKEELSKESSGLKVGGLFQIILFFVLFFLFGGLSRRGRYGSSGIWYGGGFGGGGGSSSSGGWSGGGGSFGGGGSSSSW